MILFACENAGHAKYFVPLIQHLNNKIDLVCVASDVSRKVFKRHKIKTISCPTDENFFKKFKVIILGSCLDKGIDKTLLKKPAATTAKTIVIFEQWAFARRRLMVKNQLVLPDAIITNDALATKEAVSEGLPESIMHPLGNPWLERLANKKIPFASNKKKSDARKVLFISEEYADEFPAGTPFDQGFTEFEALNDILSVLNNNDHLTIKLHPSEPPDKYLRVVDDVQRRGISALSKTYLSLEQMVQNYDFIIGLGSMLLIELSLFRSDIISYRPRELMPFMGNTLGATRLVKKPSILKKILDGQHLIKNNPFGEKYQGSTEKIAKFLLNMHGPSS